ncbi:MAG: DUF4469 domain-containing protein [Treponema sp.]
MTKKKYVWGVYLRPNPLTKDNDRDCIAEVYSHTPTQRNEDIAALITKERSEFRPETILNILDMRDKAVLGFIRDGLSFMDGVSQISPRVAGVWETENAQFDEKIHNRTADMIPTMELRNIFDKITVKVLGAKEDSAKIASVTDTVTGLKDGTITIGDDIMIEGEKLKINEDDVEQGVFFITEDGSEFKTERRLSINKPSQLMARVPKNVPEGKVTIKVLTKYTHGGLPLKELREVVYGYPCTAKKA